MNSLFPIHEFPDSNDEGYCNFGHGQFSDIFLRNCKLFFRYETLQIMELAHRKVAVGQEKHRIFENNNRVGTLLSF